MTTVKSAISFNQPRRFWSERHPASLTWLALGLLLAAWNSTDDDAGAMAPRALRQRPIALRGHAPISVRALARMTGWRQ